MIVTWHVGIMEKYKGSVESGKRVLLQMKN